MNGELTTLLLAALPLTELRGSIPFAVSVLHLTPWTAFFYSIIGNAIPVPIIFYFLPKILVWLEKRIPWLHKHLTLWLERKRTKFQTSYDKYGAMALAIFVAIPLPLTGAWSGAALATILKIRPRYSFPAVIVGTIVAGVIVTLIVQGALGFLRWLL